MKSIPVVGGLPRGYSLLGALLMAAVLGLATLLTLGVVGAKPASAQEVASSYVETSVPQTTCAFNASKTYLSTGATVRFEEGGRSGVEQFRVQFLLYKLNDSARSTDAPEARRTYESEYFGDTEATNTFETSHTFRQLPATGQYVLRVKFIFVGASSANWTTDARICNNTKGGYVGDKYYAPPTK